MREMERRTYLRNFLIFLFTFYIKEISGSISNLRVTDLGSESLDVSWDVTTGEAFSIEATISPVDDSTSTTPQVSTTTTARWMRLIPGTKYRVKVGMIQRGIEVSTSLIFVTTIPAAPMDIRIMKFAHPILNNFRVTGSKTMMYPVFGAVVAWDQPPIGEHDDFEVTVDPPDGDVRVPNHDNMQQRRIVWDLTPGVQYEFTVRSKKNGVFSAPVSANGRMAPDQPNDVKVTRVTPTSAVVSWDGEHRGILDDYVVETTPDGASVSLVNGNPTHPSRRLDDLIPGTKHKATVYSSMAGLLGFKPSSKDFYTPPAVPVGPVVREEITPESVFTTWNRPQGGVDYYEVVYFPTERDFGRQRERVWDPRLNLTREMVPATSYMVEIYTVSNNLYSEPLRQMVHTRPLPPNNVIATATQDTIELVWDTDHSDSQTVIKYSLETENEVITETVDAGTTETTITNLNENSKYFINVTTIRNEVESDPILLIVTTNPNSSSDERRFTPVYPNNEKSASTTTSPSTEPVTTYAALIRETSPAETTTTKSVSTESTSTTTERTTPATTQQSTAATTRSTTKSTTAEITTTTTTEKSTTTTTQPSTTSTQQPTDETSRTTRATTTTKTTTTTSTTDSTTTSTEPTPEPIVTTTTTQPTAALTTTATTTQAPERRRSGTTKATTPDVTKSVRATRSSAPPGSLFFTSTPTTSMSKSTTKIVDIATPAEVLPTTTQPTTVSVIKSTTPTEIVSKSTEKTSHPTTFVTTEGIRAPESTTRATSQPLFVDKSTTTITSGATSIDSNATPASGTRSSSDIGTISPIGSDTTSQSGTRSASDTGTISPLESDTTSQSGTRSASDTGTISPVGSDTTSQSGTRSASDIGTISPLESDTTTSTSPIDVSEGSTIGANAYTTIPTTRPQIPREPEIIDTTPTSQATATGKTITRSAEATPNVENDSSTEGAESTASTSNPFGPGNFSDVTTTKTTTPQTITVPTKTTVMIEEGVETLCEPDNITVLVNKSVIEIYEKDYGPLRFDEGDCMGVEHDTYYRYTIAPNISRCGTMFVDNGTHVNISNTLSNTQRRQEWLNTRVNQTTGLVDTQFREKTFPKVYLHIRCTFPSQLIVETKFIPVPTETVITFNVSGVGHFEAIMQLFRDDKYRYPYYSAPSLPSNGRIRVGIKLLKTKDEHISIAARKCWATPVSDSDYKVFYPLIDDYCVKNGALGGKLVILENGESKTARFEGPVFRFVKHTEVWLHCELKVCFGDSCDTDCSGNKAASRQKRAAPYRPTGPIISAGPIRLRESKNKIPEEKAEPKSTSDESINKDSLIIIVAASLAAVVLLLSVVIVIVFLKYRRTAPDKKAITHPDFNSSSWDRHCNVFEDLNSIESGPIERRYAPDP